MFSFTAFSQKVSKNIPKPPVIEGKSVTDSYWGVDIEDPYRNIENLRDTLVQSWLKSHSIYADTLLIKINGRDSLISNFKKLKNRKSSRVINLIVTENNSYFFLKRNKNEKEYKLYYKKSRNADDELLYDPKNFKPDTGNEYKINFIEPSWDGKHIIVSMVYSGKEYSEMMVIDVKNKTTLPQIITNCLPKSSGVFWLPDSSGFIYTHIPIIDLLDDDFRKDMKSVLYKIGQDPTKLKVIFSAETHPELNIKPRDHPIAVTYTKSQNYLVCYLAGVDNYWDAYYTNIKSLENDTIIWKPLHKKEDKVYRSYCIVKGDDFIFISGKNASNFKIATTNIATLNFHDPEILVQEKKDEIINDIIVNPDGLYYTTIKNGVEAKLYHQKNKIEREIKLPKKSGNVFLRYKSLDSTDLWVNIRGWLNVTERYKYKLDTNTFTRDEIVPVGQYPEFDDFIVKEVLVPSHDGVEVPLSIIHHKDLKLNGKNPVFINGYGAYGRSRKPYFSYIRNSWVLEGGIYCIAHVRGGGEKGDTWHKAGQKTTKPNTWKDLIACTEYLIDKKYTSKKYTAIYGGSAGGIMIGGAVTERPDLFAAAISSVGMMNPLRSETRKGGGTANAKEYGTVKDSLECMGLIAMDPYLRIKKKTQYPAMMLTAGMNDPRVSPWVPGKFVAQMQASDTKNPIVFDVDYNAGHNGNSSPEEKWANYYAFVLWQMGHPDYQMKEE